MAQTRLIPQIGELSSIQVMLFMVLNGLITEIDVRTHQSRLLLGTFDDTSLYTMLIQASEDSYIMDLTEWLDGGLSPSSIRTYLSRMRELDADEVGQVLTYYKDTDLYKMLFARSFPRNHDVLIKVLTASVLTTQDKKTYIIPEVSTVTTDLGLIRCLRSIKILIEINIKEQLWQLLIK